VFGICGGLQMLGRQLADPEGLEGPEPSAVAGLSLLPLETVFAPEKTLRRTRARAHWPPGGDPLEIEGFELHHGRSASGASPLAEPEGLGYWQPSGAAGGVVAGTYLHAIFENGPWRRRWLNRLRQRRGLPLLSEHQPHQGRQRDQLLDRLADAFEAHVDLTPLLGDQAPR
jgi:adenosylcobyric acid synthase